MKFFYVFLFSAFFNLLLAQGGFGISNNNLYWEMILEKDIDLENQEIQLNPKSSGVKSSQVGIYIRDLKKASLIVQHKEGKTRFLVTEIMSNTPLLNLNDIDISSITIKKDGTYTNFFVKRDSIHLSKIIKDAILATREAEIANKDLLSDW